MNGFFYVVFADPYSYRDKLFGAGCEIVLED